MTWSDGAGKERMEATTTTDGDAGLTLKDRDGTVRMRAGSETGSDATPEAKDRKQPATGPNVPPRS
jgi:hypothetical protein